MLATDAAGSALMAANGKPDAMNAASVGAKTVNSLFLSVRGVSIPDRIRAALMMLKLGLVVMMSVTVLPVLFETIGIAAGTSLLQEVDAATIIKKSGRMNLNELYIFFMIFFLFQ
jgi:hypothetical protein